MHVRPSLALSRASCTVCHRHKSTHTHEKQCSDTNAGSSHHQFPSQAPQLQQFHDHALITIIRMLQWISALRRTLCPQHGSEQLLHEPTDQIHLKEALLDELLLLLMIIIDDE